MKFTYYFCSKVKVNVIQHSFKVSRNQKENLNGHRALVVWFTGLSGSGKSTLANALEVALFEKNIRTCCLDGDNTRLGINKDLGFSLADRTENIRRVAEMSKLFLESGTVVITSFISPLKADRQNAKAIIGKDAFVEIFVDCPLSVCESRDVKGLYAKARKGEIRDFTGIDSPFEEPENASLQLNTANLSIEDCVKLLLEVVLPKISMS
jgi:adenylylsulfate kinase